MLPAPLARDTPLSPKSRMNHQTGARSDFAFRRRRRYGTILVDLERHRPVDLLPDRTAHTLASWLKAHPGVAIISRDRGGDYAVGAREGTPDALQVADRFHLIKNLGELIERVLRRHAPALQQLTSVSPSTNAAAAQATVPPRSEREAARAQVQAKIRHRYEAIHALATQGLSGQAIADALGLNPQTVARNLRLPTCPHQARHPRQTHILDPYEPYLRERWQQGYHRWLGGRSAQVRDEANQFGADLRLVVTLVCLATPQQRERKSQRLLGELQALGAQFVEQRGHPCRALAWRLWHFQDELLTCVRHPEVPPDNNAAERAIRPLVIARKISGGTRPPRGSPTRMRLANLFGTWTASGLHPLAECCRLLPSPLPQI